MQHQAMGRGGWSGLGPVPAGDDLGDAVWFPESTPNVQQGSHHIADLSVQESISFHVNSYFVRIPLNCTTENRSHHAIPLAPGCRHGGKIHLPDKVRRGFSHGPGIERTPIMIDVPMQQMLNGTASRIPNSIAIKLPYGRMCGMKGRRYVAKVKNGHIIGQSGSDGMLELSTGKG